ncbi:hypothetical protein OE88DRAFT_1659438 [Heliocybe sulcata]|uniref:Protein kinase domain-containing protein n=1 Tax=Heliocybe sulcata TaxID=5364 RepID=A0A5C3N1C0_9AGAM|nr:hypothetical protein OE88DRAFT_1659438 [Heliocybe sulcata]
MAEKTTICYPILLTPPSSAEDAVNQAPRFLLQQTFTYERSQDPRVSDLVEDALQQFHMAAQLFGIDHDSEMSIVIWEILEPKETVNPDKPQKQLEMHYEKFTEDFLAWNAMICAPARPFAIMKPENLVASLSVTARFRRRDELDPVQETGSFVLSRDAIAISAQQRRPPSSSATASEQINIQTPSRNDAVHNYRPADLVPPVITIYHRAFSTFLQIMEQELDFTPGELDFAQEFIREAVKFHPSEGVRWDSLTAVDGAVDPHTIGLRNLDYGAISRFISDGVAFSHQAPNGFKTAVCITELTNEIGEGKCDPITKAECTYVAIYSSDEARPVRDRFCCPAFLVGIAGPYIQVKGAIFTDVFISQALTDYVSLVPVLRLNGRGPLDDATYHVARLFRAMKTAIAELDQDYMRVVEEITPSLLSPMLTGTTTGHLRRLATTNADDARPAPIMIAPHFSEFPVGGRKCTLKYINRFVREYANKMVFLAEANIQDEPSKVVVKFTATYNVEAHKLLANATPPHAPKLYHCEFEPSVGMFVVVMAYVQDKGPDFRNPRHTESLREAVQLLHTNEFVFGDLRAPNILVPDNEAILIDFDWCGKVGEARYPSDINLDENCFWHPDVHRGRLIQKDHDAHLFKVESGQEL